MTVAAPTMPSRNAHAESALALTVPRQHGAWSVLLLGYALGVGALGVLGAPSGLFLAATVAGFLARHAVAAWLRLPATDPRRPGVAALAVGYGATVAGAVGTLVLGYGRSLLIPFGAVFAVVAGVSAWLEWRHRDRTAWGELANIAGLSLVTPAAAYAATGVFGAQTLALWLLAVACFTASVFHVRYLVRRQRGAAGPLAQRLRAGLPSLAYHLGWVVLVAALAVWRVLPPLAPLALGPALAKALWAVLRRHAGPPAIRRLGFLELAHGIAFAALAIVAFHLGPTA